MKEDLKHGRISPDMIRFALCAFMVFSVIMVGIAYSTAAVNDLLIGWKNLSIFWKTVFKLEALLFIFQLILITFVKGKSNWSQILLNVSYVIYAYKMAIDPFVMVSMFALDAGEYEVYGPFILLIILLGFILHVYLIRRYFLKMAEEQLGSKQKTKEKNNRSNVFYKLIPIFFLLSSMTGYIIRNDLLLDGDLIFIIGIVEFVIGAYCVIRFPSFRVNPPTEKNRSMH